MLKPRRSDAIVCSVILLSGILAAVFGLVAETKRIKPSQVSSPNGQCAYPHNPAFILGLVAAFCLLLAQVVAYVAGGCVCCSRGPNGPYPSSSTKSIAVLILIISWVTFFNALMLLLAGARLQNWHRQDEQLFAGKCFVVKQGVFAAGALLSLATACFGVVYYLAVLKLQRSVSVNEQLPTVTLGQAYGPMFVPENYPIQQPVISHYPVATGYPSYPPSNHYYAYTNQSQMPTGSANDCPKT